MSVLENTVTNFLAAAADRTPLAFSPYRVFSREEWAKLRADTPKFIIESDATIVAPLRERVRRFEVSLILRAIEDAGGDRRVAAQKLGIGRNTITRKLGATRTRRPRPG